MRRSTRKSSIGIGLGVEERLNSNPLPIFQPIEELSRIIVGFSGSSKLRNPCAEIRVTGSIVHRMNKKLKLDEAFICIFEGLLYKCVQIGSFSTRFSLSSFVKRVEKLTDDQRNAIKKVGFGNLLLIPNQMLSKNLLVELMERWNFEERGFMLLPGIIKITLMDVALILGIRVTGDPILLREDEAFSDLESDYGAALWKRKITVASLESRLDSLGELVNEDFVRTFILFTFGTVLFPNANGKVDSRYLSFLKNLDDIGHFAWGAAVLEDIFMWLNKRKESNVQYVGGCLILLQIWCYEHIDLARPDLIDGHLMFPRACRWENSRSHQRQWFTAKFRELQDHQITWQLQPTSEELQFDVINELLEVESSSIDNSSDGGSIIAVVGLEIESIGHYSSKVQAQQVKEIDLKKSIVSQNKPEVQTPSTSCASVLHKDGMELSSQCQNSDKLTRVKVVGPHLESDGSSTSEEQESNLNQS
ncbi:protein MAIN-LIKE 1-like, partial [Durio zibethinus]|uniref:Protein MAIN-LIKE 1-like n=1 Tax=Durio zibethinus TaxID=66656 RepID=A0A6P6A928_DURZI